MPYLDLNLPKGAAFEWFIARPSAIIGIIIVGLLFRLFVHHLIDRIVRRASGGSVPGILARSKAGEFLSDLRPGASERRKQRSMTMGALLKRITTGFILTVAFLMILDQLHFNIAPLLASAGILGVAFGFGAQSLVKDFLSGIFMILEDQYGVGDIVDLGEASGVVETVGLRVTALRDINGTLWYCRNGAVLRVGNKSQGFAVAVIDLPLAHSTDVDVASAVAGRVAAEAAADSPIFEDVLEPAQVLGVDKVTADTVTLRITVKVRPGRQWAVQRALNQRILDEFDEQGIRPPYPQGRPAGLVETQVPGGAS